MQEMREKGGKEEKKRKPRNQVEFFSIFFRGRVGRNPSVYLMKPKNDQNLH